MLECIITEMLFSGFHRLGYFALAWLGCSVVLHAAEEQPKQDSAAVHSEALAAEAVTLLRSHCMACHGETKRKGGLAMHSRKVLMEGGESGPVVQEGNPSKSPLIALLREDADPHMPPKEQLPAQAISQLEEWVRQGAHWAKPTEQVRFPIPNWSKISSLPQPVMAVAARPGGTLLAQGLGQSILLRSIPPSGTKPEDSQPIRSLEGHLDLVRSLAWSPDGQQLASGGHARVILWDPWEGKPARILTNGLEGRVTAMAFQADGKRLLVADGLPGFSGRLSLYSVPEGNLIQQLPEAHGDTIYGLSLAPDGSRWMTASADKTARLWEVGELKPLGTLEGHTDFVLAASFNPDGTRAVTVGADALVKIWDVSTRKQISEFSDSQSNLPLSGVWWGWDPGQKKQEPDTEWILTISEDGKPRAWDRVVVHEGAERSSGARMKAWSANVSGLTCLTPLPDGQRFVAGDTEGNLAFWDAKGTLLGKTKQP